MDNNDSEEEISEKHGNLLKFIEKLDGGQRIKQAKRSEPTLQVSEYHLVNSGITEDDAVCVDDLVKTLGGRTHYTDINKKIKAAKKGVSILPKPLEKPAAEKLKRAVGFENTTKELEKWNAIVTRNRIVPTQVFPLQRPSSPSKPDEFVNRFKIQSELEKELNALEPIKPSENGEKTNEFALSLEEIVLKRHETAKFRVQESYKQAKAHRLKKIKSKKFHRIAKKAKIKEQFNEFLKLQETDPQAALVKLEQLNKVRAEERMSLKHKNTSQWAKNKQIRAKYDKESRSELAKQLSISRELMEKVTDHANSDDEMMENETGVSGPIASTTNNPWTNTVKTSSEIDEFVSGFRKYWEKEHEANKQKDILLPNSNEDECIPCDNRTGKICKSASEKIELSTGTTSGLTQHRRKIGKKKPNDDIDASEINEVKKNNHVTQRNNVKPSGKELSSKANIISDSMASNMNGTILKAGTTEWTIENLENTEPSTNNIGEKLTAMDDIFDAIDDNTKRRIKKKLRQVKRKLTETPAERSKCAKVSNHPTSDLSFKNMKLRPQLDESLDESVTRNGEHGSSPVSIIDRSDASNNSSTLISSEVEINPNKFINVRSRYSKDRVVDKNDTSNEQEQVMKDCNEEENENEEMDDNISQQNIITEAFADDNVVDEFRKEKADKIEKLQSETVNAQLPGWGVWGGNNIKHIPKKKRRFILKFPQKSLKNDENEGNVILLQDNSTLKKHQVNDLPHPFSSVSDFETSIRAPIGRNFIPENAHKKLIEPTVKTRMGKVISPMGEDALIEKKNIKSNGDLRRSNKIKL